jgi:hypothetical protein
MMTLRLIFPDGREEEIEIEICDYNSIEEVAEAICEDMADKYVSAFLEKRGIKGEAKRLRARMRYVEGCVRWLYPLLLSTIAEYIEAHEGGIR